MSLGSFCLVLHGHLPYVLRHGTWPHGEDWLYEAAAETYLQLAAREPSRVSPLIKAARAYLAAGEPVLASRACHQGLATDAENQTLRDLLNRAAAAAEAQAKETSEKSPE